MQKTTVVLTVVLLVLVFETYLYPAPAAGKLIDLLPGLYGGDGILLATDPAADHTAHFRIGSTASINRLNEQIATQIGTFPFSSSVGGFTFALDPLLGTFVRTTETLGPLFAERAPTLGRGRLSLNASYTFFRYDTFDGHDLDHFDVVARHDPSIIGFPDEREQFENDVLGLRLDIDIKVQILALAATYGITDRLDIGIFVPFVHVDMRVKSIARVVPSPDNTLFPDVHTFTGGPESPVDEASDDATGLGDIVLRVKYYMLKSSLIDVAAAVLVKLETGDADNFLGTGDTTVRPFVVVSRTFFDVPLLGFNVTPHLNLGYEFNVDHRHENALEYVLGFDVGSQRLVIAGEIIGSHELDGDGIGDNLVNASVGIKWNPLQRFILAANVQFPLNHDGLRSAVIPTFGVEYSF
jgi:hypothetical protein